MSFVKQTPRLFTKADVQLLNHSQNGVYGIFKSGVWLYVGKGDIRQRLLDHLNGDVPGLLASGPTHWVAESIIGDPSHREKELIVKLKPLHNKKVG